MHNAGIEKKDLQRMMEHPMFKIVRNSRLFLTAVTPTAIATIVFV